MPFTHARRRGATGCSVVESRSICAIGFFLAVVQVEGGFARAPVYVQRFFARELGFGETAVVFDVDDLLSLARPAAAWTGDGRGP